MSECTLFQVRVAKSWVRSRSSAYLRIHVRTLAGNGVLPRGIHASQAVLQWTAVVVATRSAEEDFYLQ